MPAALPADRQLDDGKGTGVGEAGGKHWGCWWGEVDGRQLPAEAGVDPGDTIVIRKEPKEGAGWHGLNLWAYDAYPPKTGRARFGGRIAEKFSFASSVLGHQK